MAVVVASGHSPSPGPVNAPACSSEPPTEPLSHLQQQMGDQTICALIALLQQVTTQLQSSVGAANTVGNDFKTALSATREREPTRDELDVPNASEATADTGAVVKREPSKRSRWLDDSVAAVQPAMQQYGQDGSQDVNGANPGPVQPYQKNETTGNSDSRSNIVRPKRWETRDPRSLSLTDRDAQRSDSQEGDNAKRKAHSKGDQAFAQAFGTDTLFRCASRNAEAFGNAQDSGGHFMDQLASPISHAAIDLGDLVHGDAKSAISETGEALEGAARDGTMVVAPGTPPQAGIDFDADAYEMAARGAAGRRQAAPVAISAPLAA